jgi:hypothetical protein
MITVLREIWSAFHQCPRIRSAFVSCVALMDLSYVRRLLKHKSEAQHPRHLDWFPTLLAAAGDTTMKDRLLEGANIGGKRFKVHLDGYNQLPTCWANSRAATETSSITSTTMPSWLLCDTTSWNPEQPALPPGRLCSANSGSPANSMSGRIHSPVSVLRECSICGWIPSNMLRSQVRNTTSGGMTTDTEPSRRSGGLRHSSKPSWSIRPAKRRRASPSIRSSRE